MRHVVMTLSLAVGLVLGTAACGGGGGGKDQPAKQAKAKKKRRGKQIVEPDIRPPAKTPRPPFLTLPESDATAAKVLSEGKDRKLLGLPQKGPFGEGDSITVLYLEPGEDEGTERVGGVVVRNAAGLPLPIDNDVERTAKPELVWASGEHGWQLVLVVPTAGEGEPTFANQAFYWDGSAFARDVQAERKIREMSSPSAIRQALL